MKKTSIFLIIQSAIIVVLLIVVIKMGCNMPEIVDESKVESIIMINDNTSTAEKITNKKDIHNICDTLNSTKMELVGNWENFYVGLPDGNQAYHFIFVLKYGIQQEFSYSVGNGIIYNGSIYQTDSDELAKFWDLDYKKKDWKYSNFE